MPLLDLNRHYDIKNGPHKWDLLVSLGHGHGWQEQPEITFHLDHVDFKITAKIRSLAREDGGGQNWIYEASPTNLDRSVATRIRGHYSTHTRRGSLTIYEV